MYHKRTQCPKCKKEALCVWHVGTGTWICHNCLYPVSEQLADLAKAIKEPTYETKSTSESESSDR